MPKKPQPPRNDTDERMARATEPDTNLSAAERREASVEPVDVPAPPAIDPALQDAPQEAPEPAEATGEACVNHPDREAVYETVNPAVNKVYYCDACGRMAMSNSEGIQAIGAG